jgi:hypothetical protein
MTETIQEAYKNVELFNKIASNLDNVTPESIDNQLSFIYEELCETIDAVEYGNDLEALDGCCDLFVTVAGLMQKLEAAGFDVSEALKKVNENNLSKFPLYDVRNNELAPANTRTIIDANHGVLIFKDIETGKIRKPTNFVPVNLSGYEVVGFLSGNEGGD